MRQSIQNIKANLSLCLLLLPLAFASCSSDSDTIRYAEIQDYYTESMNLTQVTTDSVYRFTDKVQSFIYLHPDAYDDPLIPQIEANIRKACLNMTITVDPNWDGEIHINY